MLTLPDSFLESNVAIIIPRKHFHEFCDACEDAGLRDAEATSYTRE